MKSNLWGLKLNVLGALLTPAGSLLASWSRRFKRCICCIVLATYTRWWFGAGTPYTGSHDVEDKTPICKAEFTEGLNRRSSNYMSNHLISVEGKGKVAWYWTGLERHIPSNYCMATSWRDSLFYRSSACLINLFLPTLNTSPASTHLLWTSSPNSLLS